MRIWENIKWLLNHPPTSITRDLDPDRKCDYCDDEQGPLFHHHQAGATIFTICSKCQKKAFDAVLRKDPPND